MTKLGLVVRLQAKAGNERKVAEFLRSALPAAQAEAQTPLWFAFDAGGGTFYIVDAFADEAGRDAHLSGPIAEALMKHAPELLSEAPQIEKVSVLAEKVTT